MTQNALGERRRRAARATCAVALAFGLAFALQPASAAGSDDHELFETRIRPLLQQRCFKCHGEDTLGGLTLSSRAALLAGGASGPAIVPGDPDRSLLIQAVRHELPKLEMPMTGGRLTAQQVGDLEEWVRRGAPWPGQDAPGEDAPGSLTEAPSSLVSDEHRAFWSFQRLSSPEPPVIEGSDASLSAIDHFLGQRLEAEGLEPLPPADERQLLRRVTFDLTGLPPTPAEIEAFLADDSPEAYARVIDRLLASPHYGERWGRHWLDVVRYGEDDSRTLAEDESGHERYPNAYVYRDWVIRAFNEDLPYDRFVKAQLAGDLLPEAERREALPGLGFLGIGPWYYDIAEPAIARADERHDRVDVTTRAFLGLTVGCARCHNHKYDPIPTADYYALAGVFANTDYHEYPIGTAEEIAEYEQDRKLEKALREARKQYQDAEAKQLSRRLAHHVSRYMMGAWKVTGEPKLEVTEVANQDELDLELLERFVRFTQKEPKHYPHLRDWQEMIAAGGDDEEQKERAQGLADRFQRELLDLLVRRDELEEHNEYLIARGSPKPPRERKSVPMPNDFESFFDQHQLELETLEGEQMKLYTDVFELDLDLTVFMVKYEPGLLRSWGWGLERQISAQSRAHLDMLETEIEELKDPERRLPFVMGVAEKDPEQIADLELHLRGSPKNLGAPVPRHFLTVLSSGEPERYVEGSGRLRLAEQIAEHPITARVLVNRIWRWHFGTGIVESPSNFGIAGEAPSHPELLEHLASRFVESGRSIKALHREILLSAAYQRASAAPARDRATADLVARNEREDPGNRLYWRANRRRLDAESIRDALLAVGGNLDPAVGGASKSLDDEENLRRTVYARVSRFQLDTYLQTFDFPNPAISAERRFTTNVPLQNLYFMNSELVRRQAEALAKRLAGTPGAGAAVAGAETAAGPNEPADVEEARETVPDDERIRRAYVLLYGREVTPEELELGLDFLERARREAAAPAAAEGSGPEPGAGEPTGDEQPGGSEDPWVRYARALLAANEFRFVG
ncbi:MAG TPA: PSD1 and planctomycete cytochrome C domain-containing protein [Thermoanaerobaculia bacterium]|nr:PSD1 and planctomycete cytochrome C domain-containing protein [Thermoanaerobaculia bacterium]